MSNLSEFEIEQWVCEGNDISLLSVEDQVKARTFQKESQDFVQTRNFDQFWNEIQNRLDSQSESTDFTDSTESNVVLISSNTSKRQRIFKTFYSALAIAALFVLALNVNQFSKPEAETSYIGIKGTYAFDYIENSEVKNLKKSKKTKIDFNSAAASNVLSSGSQIRFTLQNPGHGHVMILSIEETGKINLYRDSAPTSQNPRIDHVILSEKAYQLDDYVGEEYFIAFFSKSKLEFSKVKDWLTQNKIHKNINSNQIQSFRKDVSIKTFSITKE